MDLSREAPWDWSRPAHAWGRAQLRSFAWGEGEGWSALERQMRGRGVEWRYEAALPVEALLGRGTFASRDAAREWLAEEVAARAQVHGPAYLDELKAAVVDGWRDLPPIVAGCAGGVWDLGDGWHRFAIAAAHGLATIPAVVGRVAETGIMPATEAT